MQCDLCGKDENIIQATIEGVEMNVCRDCAKFGKVINPQITEKIEKHRVMKGPPEFESPEIIVLDFKNKIREAREKKGLNQEDFAKLLNEKASIIHKLETGTFIPSIPLAKKLEKALRIKLIEHTAEELSENPKPSSTGTMTIGDIINKK